MGVFRVIKAIPVRRCAPCCAILSLVGLCFAPRPAAAQDTMESGNIDAITEMESATVALPESASPAEAGAAGIRASEERPGIGSMRRRLPIERMLRDILFGVAWDRTRLPLRASLYGNESKTLAVQLSISRRNFNGVTVRLKF